MSDIGRPNPRDPVRNGNELATARPQAIDHEERARQRMAQLRALHGDLDFVDADWVDPWIVLAPPGWSYNWKTYTVWNREYPDYYNSLLRTGWEPVPADRHREKLWPGYDKENIIKEGLILMERPLELTKRIEAREYRRAVDVVRLSEIKLHETPAGTAPRDANPRTAPVIRHSVGPAEIPQN